MIKDYAKTRRINQPPYSRKPLAPSKSTQSSHWYLLAGLLMGSLIIGGYWLIATPNLGEGKLSEGSQKELKDLKRQTKNKTKNKSPVLSVEKPRFDFYTLLPNMEATVPDSAQATKVENLSNTKKENSFLIQVGAFHQFAEADSLKAHLVLMGFDEPYIQSFETKTHEQWFRVLLGPFQQEAEAKTMQANLAEQQLINTLILKK
jgi:cell division protein FtsN